MMDDRKLLEMAAEVAGLGPLYKWDEESACIKYPYKSELTDGHLWNPLTDDGDALRLAVYIGIDVTVSGKHAAVTSYINGPCFQEIANGDIRTATRRAIVRAAAEIGKR